MIIKGIFSINPQVGKTTFGLNTIKNNPSKDHYFMTHDLDTVLRDACTKASMIEIYPEFLKDIEGNKKKRDYDLVNNDNDREPRVLFGLGNINQLTQAENLIYAAKLSGKQQCLHMDEIHKYCIEDDSNSNAKRDSWLKICIARNFVDILQMYTASGHDIIIAPYITFNGCTILQPYAGYKGYEDAVWHIKSQEFFNKVRDAHKDGKRPPTDFIDFILQYPNMLINISTQNSFHDWLCTHVPEYKQYNQKFKNDSHYLVGGLGLGMSSTFRSNFMMFNRNSNSHRALKWQTFGRAYGSIIPHLCGTENDKAEMDNYYENMQKLITEEIIMLPGEERAKYAESLCWVNPRTVSNPKLKRRIEEFKINKKGTEDNLVEDYYSVHMGLDLCPGTEEWRNNQTPMEEIWKKFLHENPDVIIPKNAVKKAIQHKDELNKFRSGKRIADIRIGQDYSKPGRAYVIIRRGNYQGTFSFYNYDKTLLSSEEIREGKIYVETENRSAA